MPKKCWTSMTSTSQTKKKLFYVLLLTSSFAILYFYSRSGVLNSVLHRSRSTVVLVKAWIQNVVLNQQNENDDVHVNSTADMSSSSTVAKSLVVHPTSPPSIITSNMTGVDGYVHFGKNIPDAGVGLGNLMFNLAAVVYVANLTGRQPGILGFSYQLALDEVFDLHIRRFDDLCPCYEFGEPSLNAHRYDSRVEDLINGSEAQKARGKSIYLHGYFQSWKYTRGVERQLRQHFTFLPEIRNFVDEFMAASKPPGWQAYIRVGVHVRRGNVVLSNLIQFGYTTPDKKYFAHAMRYFVDRFERVQFIVVSNDMDWCRENFADFENAMGRGVNVTYLTSRSRGEDFAVLASCDHVIMSTGTYGWWAAWLARGITIYYSDWPRNGSNLARTFAHEDFFPPNWIGMT